MRTTIAADLRFELEREGLPPVTGRIHGSGSRLVLDVDAPDAFAGARDAPAVRGFAEALAERRIVVRVESGGQHLITVGDVRSPWWQRRLTGSRRIRMGSLRGAVTAARARTGGREQALPDLDMLPPATMWPPAPTFLRRPRRHPTTTHDPGRGGGARLYLVQESVYGQRRQPPVYWLEDGSRIGSGPDCEIRLPGLSDVHARLVHDENDEWVVEALGGLTRVHGQPVDRQILRTGTGLSVGAHRLSFYREEHADHGRPHGGRIGGELGRQVPQEPRARRPEDPASPG